MKSRCSGILVAAVLLCGSGRAWTQPVTNPELDRGIDLVQRGYFEKSIEVLRRVATQLKTEEGEPKLRARAYLYLAIAHHGLGQGQTASALFIEAVNTDGELEVSPDEFPPRIVQFFDTVRQEGMASGQIRVVEPSPARTAEPAPTPSPASEEAAPADASPSASDELVPTITSASPVTFKKVDFFRTYGDEEKKFDARLTLDPVRREIVLSDEKRKESFVTYVRIPYDTVTGLAYERSKHGRLKGAMIFSKGKKHWLTISFEGVSSFPASFVSLRLDKQNYHEILAALESATGIAPSINIE